MRRTVWWVVLALCSCGGMRAEYEEAKRLAWSPKSGPEEWRESIGRFERIVRLKVEAREQQFQVWRRLGDHYLSRNMWKDALESYAEAAKIRPGSASVLYKMGLCWSQLYRFAPEGPEREGYLWQAVGAYERALEADPDHAATLYALAILEFWFTGRRERGVEMLRRLLEKQPSHTEALFALGRFYYEMGRYGEALEVYRRLEKVLGSSKKAAQVRENIRLVQRRLDEG